jgi:aminoglycoside 6'-N-acetyltransferase-1b
MNFQELTEADLPTLAEWLSRPHVTEWWDSCNSLEEVRANYVPRPGDHSAASPYFAYLDDAPVGYIQFYVPAAAVDGWWSEQLDPGVRGIDQFLADGNKLDQGLGTQMVRDFVELLFRDPSVTSIQADPNPFNVRAIRCYEKAGFRRVASITTPDGPAILMMIDRAILSDR